MPLLSSHPHAGWSISHALRRVRHALLWAFLTLATCLALPSLLIGLLLWWSAGRTWDTRERWSGIWLLAGVCGAVYGGLLWLSRPLPFLLQAVAFGLLHHALAEGMGTLAHLWALHLLLTPVCALILEGLHPLSRRVRLRPRRPPSNPTGCIAQVSTQAPPLEPLGEFLGGDLYEWVYGSQLCIPLAEMARHMVVVGEPGYGKTMTLLQLASIAVRYAMQVVYIDLKGSVKTAAQFVALMRLLGVQRVKVYPREAYDGWRGEAQTLYNRLMQMVDAGTHPFYRRLTSSLLSLAVNAPGGPPRSSQEFLRRLDRNWLYRAYVGKTPEHAYARRKIARLVPHLDDLSLPFEGFFDGIAGALDGTWAFEDGDAAYLGLDGDAQKEQAALMGRYLLEDCAHYAKYRKGARHALLVLDEFGVLASPNATDLYERVRESGVSVCAAAQSFEGLGPERRQVVSASSIKILHRCGDPEELVKYAGEREVAAFSHLLEEDEAGALRSMGDEADPRRRTAVRMQRQYAMPIERVQQLRKGETGLITGGLGAWCRVYPLTIPEALLRTALAEVSTAPAVSPAPAPPVPEPSAPEKTERPISDHLAQQPSHGQERGKQRETRRSRPAQVPSTPADQTRQPVPAESLPSRATPASPRPVEGGRASPAIPAVDDDSPVDF